MSQFGASSLALLILCSTVITACQSTQATSRDREAVGAKLIVSEKGLQVGAVNTQVKVLDTAVMHDANGSAVAVVLKNDSDQAQVQLPILIDVRDAKGKTIYKNTVPGLETALTTVPLLKPGETVTWVNDQVLASGVPASVKVKVGQPQEAPPSEIPEIDISEPKLQSDPFSGVEVSGTVENKSDIEQRELVMFAVAREGGRIVAAGRGAVRRLPTDAPKPANYHIFFIGNPRGADVTVTAPPSVLN